MANLDRQQLKIIYSYNNIKTENDITNSEFQISPNNNSTFLKLKYFEIERYNKILPRIKPSLFKPYHDKPAQVMRFETFDLIPQRQAENTRLGAVVKMNKSGGCDSLVAENDCRLSSKLNFMVTVAGRIFLENLTLMEPGFNYSDREKLIIFDYIDELEMETSLKDPFKYTKSNIRALFLRQADSREFLQSFYSLTFEFYKFCEFLKKSDPSGLGCSYEAEVIRLVRYRICRILADFARPGRSHEVFMERLFARLIAKSGVSVYHDNDECDKVLKLQFYDSSTRGYVYVKTGRELIDKMLNIFSANKIPVQLPKLESSNTSRIPTVYLNTQLLSFGPISRVRDEFQSRVEAYQRILRTKKTRGRRKKIVSR